MGLYPTTQERSISTIPRVESSSGEVEWKKDQDFPFRQRRRVYIFGICLVSDKGRYQTRADNSTYSTTKRVAERLNRTLIESVRTMLVDSKLPHRFWAEALATSVYLRNRSPTKAIEAMTPYEAWSGTKPDVSFLRVFGCSAYAHIPKAERRKLDSKARKCVMLGYGTSQKGYRLYDIEQMKVVHSRDVVFDKTSMPGIQEEGTTVKYVELEIEEESDAKETPTSEPTDSVPDDTTVQEESSEESVSADRIASESVPRRSTRSKQNLTGTATVLQQLWLQSTKIPARYLKPDLLRTKMNGNGP